VKKINAVGAFFLMIPRIVRVSPATFAVWQLLALLHGISYGVIAPVTQVFFDRAAAYASNASGVSAVFMGLAALTAAHVIKQALNGAANFLHSMYYRKAEGALSAGLHEKTGRLSPVGFEDAAVLESLNKAAQGKNEAIWYTGTIMMMLNFYIPYFACMAVYLVRIKPLLAVSLALVFTPTLLTQVLRAKIFTKAEDMAAPVRREFEYYESCIAGREYFKETRVLGAFAYFKKLYADTLSKLCELNFRASRKSDLAELGMQALSLCGYVGILLLLLDSLLSGDISVGAFAAVFGSVDQLFSLMKELVCSNLGAAARELGRVRNYLEFMRAPERGGTDADIPENAGVSLRGVSFTYSGADAKAVDGVTLAIRSGETAAVVGENGSGKTTLVRLITGLYLPDEGVVYRGDVDAKTASARSLFKNISAVFQKYRRYQMTLRENVGLGEVKKIADGPELDGACAKAGVDIGEPVYADGYDTMLSREFGGTDLSGGEWQRVAIARGFFRSHRLIVLDEPTAAIDPFEETKIYRRFAEIAKDVTAVVVTHRLGSVRFADIIFVMKRGRLVEQGTHEELIAAGGEYARLYASQEIWYR